MKRIKKHSHKIKYMVLAVLVLTLGICGYFGIRSYAADEIYIEVDGARIQL